MYTNMSSASCKKAIRWFSEECISFKEIKLNREGITTKKQLKEILILTDNGLDDILKRNVNRVVLDELSLNEALKKIVEKPSMLKVPIIISRNKIQVGFQEEYIRAFIPRSHRRLQIAM
jgi:Spx/MgsR family transcriptional regulator